MMLRSSRKRATVRRASRCGGGSAQEIPLPNDLLTYALAFAIENLHVWSNVRRVSSQFRRCLESPLALVHMAPVRANCWRLESPRALDHMAPAYASYWEGDLEFAPLVRSTCAAGVKALVLHTGAGGIFFRTVGNFPRVRQLLTLLALQKLSSFTALEHLSVEDPVTDGGLQALADTCSATLLTLRAYDTRVLTDQGLACLAVLTHLQDLVLDGDGGCPGCTEPGLCAPLAKLADLRRLSLPALLRPRWRSHHACGGRVRVTPVPRPHRVHRRYRRRAGRAFQPRVAPDTGDQLVHARHRRRACRTGPGSDGGAA